MLAHSKQPFKRNTLLGSSPLKPSVPSRKRPIDVTNSSPTASFRTPPEDPPSSVASKSSSFSLSPNKRIKTSSPAAHASSSSRPALNLVQVIRQANPSKLADFLEWSLTADQRADLFAIFGGRDDLRRCDRCQEPFEPSKADAGGCKTTHDDMDFDFGGGQRFGDYSGGCSGCGWRGTLTEDGEPVGAPTFCFVGSHVAADPDLAGCRISVGKAV
ncbi:hypothetical protein RQP46_009179 [Phenoliferia psychrophenolica]